MTNYAVTMLLSVSTLVGLVITSGCAAPGDREPGEPPGAAAPGDSEGATAAGDENLGATSAELALRPLEVSFAGCDEIASVTPVAFAKARALVPANLTLASDGTIAPFVVRVGHCSTIDVGNGPPEAGTVAQLGPSIVSPDGTGDINIYTSWYYTTSLRLALRLNLLGVPAQWSPGLDYDLEGGTLDIDVGFPAIPRFQATSAVVEPGPSSIPSTVNWWRQNGSKLTKMSTVISNAFLGVASTTLTAPPGGVLANLFGASTVSFPFLDSFNRFPAGTMTVTKN